jgi:glycerol-3-phosphate dehydrogenase
MAEDTLDFAINHHMLPKQPCRSRDIKLHGAPVAPTPGPLHRYGSDIDEIVRLQGLSSHFAATIDPDLPFTFAEVVFAVRQEMARTVEDVLSRRMRALLIDARAAHRAVPGVAAVMATELGLSDEWQRRQVTAFQNLASTFYLP